MLIFKKLTVKNFMSIGNSPISIDLNRNSTTIVSGMNGSCKTALFIESLTMGLFNKTVRNLNKGSVVNSVNNKDCRIEIEFHTNNTDYKVVRGIKPNLFEIYEDDILMNQHSHVYDQQEYLEQKILKCNFNTFIQIIAISSMKYTPFMNLPVSQRREIVDQLIGNSIYTDMKFLAKTNYDSAMNTAETIKRDLATLKSKIVSHKSNIELMSKNNDSILTDIQAMIHDKNLELSSLLLELNSIDLTSITESIAELNNKINVCNASLDKLYQKRANADNAFSNASKYIKFYNAHNNCPECKQVISADFKYTVLHEHNSTLSKVENAKSLIKEKEIELATKRNSLTESLDSLKLKINEFNSTKKRISQIEYDISQLSAKYDSVNTRCAGNASELIVQLNSMESEYDRLSESYTTILDTTQYYKELFDMLKDDGIKAILVKQYIPIINEVVNEYLEEFELPVKFELDEKFNETILSRYRDKFCYENFSTGERQKIDLSLMFAWREIAKRKNSIDCNILILDEMDAALYKDSLEVFCDCIEKMANKNNLNIFLISHRLSDIAVDKFKSSIRLEKVNNFVSIA